MTKSTRMTRGYGKEKKEIENNFEFTRDIRKYKSREAEEVKKWRKNVVNF